MTYFWRGCGQNFCPIHDATSKAISADSHFVANVTLVKSFTQSILWVAHRLAFVKRMQGRPLGECNRTS